MDCTAEINELIRQCQVRYNRDYHREYYRKNKKILREKYLQKKKLKQEQRTEAFREFLKKQEIENQLNEKLK